MDAKDDPFDDLDSLRLTPEEAVALNRAAVKPQPKRSRHRDFVMVPLVWVERLKGSTSAATWPIAIYLLYQDWRSGGEPVPMSNMAAKAVGVNRWTKWEVLREMEARGLIRIKERPRRSPLVAVLKTCRSRPA